jgi:hypothetical protein
MYWIFFKKEHTFSIELKDNYNQFSKKLKNDFESINFPLELQNLFFKLIDINPKNRPNITEIKFVLNNILSTENNNEKNFENKICTNTISNENNVNDIDLSNKNNNNIELNNDNNNNNNIELNNDNLLNNKEKNFLLNLDKYKSNIFLNEHKSNSLNHVLNNDKIEVFKINEENNNKFINELKFNIENIGYELNNEFYEILLLNGINSMELFLNINDTDFKELNFNLGSRKKLILIQNKLKSL